MAKSKEGAKMKVPTRKDLVQIFESIDPREPFGERDRAMIVLDSNTGLRVSELVGLDVCHVTQFGQVRESIEIPRQWAKGSHSRTVPLNAAARKAILVILRFNQSRGFSTAPDAPLLQDRWHRRLPVRSVQRMMQKYRERVEVFGVTPHKLRHYCASRALNRGANLRSVQHLLGHLKVTSTEIYTHINPDDLRRAVGA